MMRTPPDAHHCYPRTARQYCSVAVFFKQLITFPFPTSLTFPPVEKMGLALRVVAGIMALIGYAPNIVFLGGQCLCIASVQRRPAAAPH